MTSITLYNINGEKTGTIKLPDSLFGVKFNKQLIAQAIRVYLSNQRQAPAKTKSRGEVTGSGRKIYKQKGTGRARHGDIKAPIFVKGGIAHGPTGKQNFKLKMSKAMKKKAFLSALSKKVADSQFIALEGLEKIEPKTKKMVQVLQTIQEKVVKNEKKAKLKATLVLPDMKADNIVRSAKNISNLTIRSAKMLNTYDVLNNNLLIFVKDTVKALEEKYQQKNNIK